MYINGSLSHLGEYSIVGEMPNMILYVGKHYLDNSKELGCLGYVEKTVGCAESTSISLLNSLFDNLGEGVINRYDDFNQRTNKQIFTNSNKNITHSYTNEVSASGRVIGKLLEESISFNGSPFSTKYYTYNLDKTLKNLRIHDNSNIMIVNESFVYDEKRQLVEFSDGNNTYKYTYDNMGNITQILKNGVATFSATYINGILINSENNYIINYDSNGYPISKKSGETVLESYTWKCGRLESVEYELQQRKVIFSYNADGLRTTKKEYFGSSLTNTTRYYYDTFGFLVYETRTLNDVKLEYLYDSEDSLYGVYYNGTPYYYVRDALGTITHIVDSNLNVVTRLEYDGVYGKHTVNDLTSTGSNHISFVNPFRYKGYYYDVETNLFLVTSRYYSPDLGRFIQPADVSSLNPSSINGLNLYSYANNNPISIAYRSSSIDGSTGGGMVSSIGNSIPGSLSRIPLPAIPWLAENATTIYGSVSSLVTGIPILSHYYKYASIINEEFKLYGISRWKTSLQLSNVSFKMGALDGALIGVNVLIDMYDSYQRGVSAEGILLGGALTAASGVVMFYLNKGIMWATTTIGTAICPGIGTAIGFTVGLVGSILVDIFLGGWIADWIDNNVK